MRFGSFSLLAVATVTFLSSTTTLVTAQYHYKCPANQKWIPNAQVGCPASCEQPVPLCKAAVRPGCGCTGGRVLAGSYMPHNPNRCISPQRCAQLKPPTPAPPAPSPSPPTLTNPCAAITCAVGFDCDPTLNNGAGGCVRTTPTNPCAAITCAQGYKCDPQAFNGQGGCVPVTQPAPICAVGLPLTDWYGNRYFCGRGPGHRPCPQNYECIIAPNDAYAVCCYVEPGTPPDICTRILCPQGYICDSAAGGCVPEPTPPPPLECQVSGCRGEICDAVEKGSICKAPTCEEYCLRYAKCEEAQVQCVTAPCPPLCQWKTGGYHYQNCIKHCPGPGPTPTPPAPTPTPPAPTPTPPTPTGCRATGCRGEICAKEEKSSICIAPTCRELCLKQFASCNEVQIQCVTTPCDPICEWQTNKLAQYKNCVQQCP